MPDNIIVALIGIIPGILTFILVYRQGKKLELVRKNTDGSLGLSLQLNADNSQWRAEESGSESAQQAADQAKALLDQHKENQAKVDAETTKEPV